MNKKGNTIIESIMFFSIIVLIVQYSCILTNNLKHLDIKNYDEKYEEAYK